MTNTPTPPRRCNRDADGWCRIHEWDCADYALERDAEPGEEGDA
jgi:hypothetical protein